ncbi:MAG: aminopeptidase P family protein [Dehalococcoidales bacterium]|nr:MAG: aminopeptidase P family protein [Dehalococcoidales bacterium]
MGLSDRIEKLRQELDNRDLDGVFVSQPENRYYLSGFDGSAGYLLITAQHEILATDFRYIEQAGQQADGYEVFKISGSTEEWFPRLLADLDLGCLGFETEHVTYAVYRQLSDALSKNKSSLKLVPVDGLVDSLRAIKEPEEIELITRAAEISDKAIEYFKEIIRPGMTEAGIAWEVEKFLRDNGSQTIPFGAIVASGPNSAMPHAKPSERKIETGEPVLIDIGARFGKYASDISRTICLGDSDETFNRIYDIVLGAQLTALSIVKEDMRGDEADGLAREVIEQAGHGAEFGHSLGHGVGLAAHERPRLGPNSDETLVSGMVFTVEPGIYLPGWGGVRIEDLVVMENGGIRLISKTEK